MPLVFYGYPACSTCKQALRFLESKGVSPDVRDIVKRPPTLPELRKMAGYMGGHKALFNTNGEVYRQMGLKDKVGTMTEQECFSLLASNGKLIKRPFLLAEGDGRVGFKVDEWEDLCRK